MSSTNSNLLIVDDDDTIQRLLAIAAKDHGWHPIAARSGQEAIELIAPGIQAVIMDVGLPGMDGIETISKLHELFPEVPVIMLTGMNDASTAVQALKAGARDYITKPFELQRLFDLLRATVKSSKSREKSATLPKKRPKVSLETSSPRMKQLFRQVEKAASLNSTILLTTLYVSEDWSVCYGVY